MHKYRGKYNLLQEPLPKLIRGLAIPASIGFFFQTMYNIIDTFYAGFISTDALAAMTLCFPLFIIILALGNGIGIGTSALVANALGAKKNTLAKSYTTQAISFGLILTILLTFLGIKFSPLIFTFLGATSAVSLLAYEYIFIIFAGTVFFVITQIFNAILMAIGDTISFRDFLIGGFFLNIFLDPLFLFGWGPFPAMGISGIALATVVIQAIGSVYMLVRVLQTKLFTFSHFVQNFIPHPQLFKDIAKQGFPASFNRLSMAIGMFIVTYFVAKFSTSAVAAIGISMRIEQVAVLPAIGLNIAALTIVGQNNGAKNYVRVKEAIKLSLKYGFLLTIVGCSFIIILAKPILLLFSQDPEVIRIGLLSTRIIAITLSSYVLYGISVSSLQAMKRPFFAMWTSVLRQFILPLIVFPLFAYTFGWGIAGVFWGIFVIAWFVAGVALFYLRRVLKKLV